MGMYIDSWLVYYFRSMIQLNGMQLMQKKNCFISHFSMIEHMESNLNTVIQSQTVVVRKSSVLSFSFGLDFPISLIGALCETYNPNGNRQEYSFEKLKNMSMNQIFSHQHLRTPVSSLIGKIYFSLYSPLFLGI